MTSLQAVTVKEHQNKCWKTPENYQFAATHSVCQLSAHESPLAAISLPVGFIKKGDNYLLTAIMGFQQDSNLFVSPVGRWLSDFIPGVYKCYPFTLVNADEGKQVLCVDEDSGLIINTSEISTEDKKNYKSFFNENGEPSEAVNKVLQHLSESALKFQQTSRLCQLFKEFDLIQPWPINVKDSEGEKKIEGLFLIDEEKLNTLSSDDFQKLRNENALPLIYAQLISMQNLTRLAKLNQAHQHYNKEKAESQTGMPEELDLEFLNNDQNLSFD